MNKRILFAILALGLLGIACSAQATMNSAVQTNATIAPVVLTQEQDTANWLLTPVWQDTPVPTADTSLYAPLPSTPTIEPPTGGNICEGVDGDVFGRVFSNTGVDVNGLLTYSVDQLPQTPLDANGVATILLGTTRVYVFRQGNCLFIQSQ